MPITTTGITSARTIFITKSASVPRVGLERTLWNDFVRGSVNYTLEDVGIDLNVPANPDKVPRDILKEVGYSLLSRFGGGLAYDTRNSTQVAR